VYFTAVANHKMLFDTHNPGAVVQLVHAECWTHTTADHAIPSPPHTGKCVIKPSRLVLPARDHSMAWTSSFTSVHLPLCCVLVFVILGCIWSVSRKWYSRQTDVLQFVYHHFGYFFSLQTCSKCTVSLCFSVQ
jgi:hypothetical protein